MIFVIRVAVSSEVSGLTMFIKNIEFAVLLFQKLLFFLLTLLLGILTANLIWWFFSDHNLYLATARWNSKTVTTIVINHAPFGKLTHIVPKDHTTISLNNFFLNGIFYSKNDKYILYKFNDNFNIGHQGNKLVGSDYTIYKILPHSVIIDINHHIASFKITAGTADANHSISSSINSTFNNYSNMNSSNSDLYQERRRDIEQRLLQRSNYYNSTTHNAYNRPNYATMQQQKRVSFELQQQYRRQLREKLIRQRKH